jgi:hypothetical protein
MIDRRHSQWWLGIHCPSQAVFGRSGDVDPGIRTRVNESPQPARLGRGLTMKRARHTVEQIIRKL